MSADKMKPWSIAAIAVLIASLPLFLKAFPQDWPNHVWMINYQARFFAHHHCFTPVLNSYEVIGIPFPIFYGYLFFPIMGMFSTVLDGNLTVRIAAIILLFFEFGLIYSSVKIFTKDAMLASAVASSVVWAIYPLTNLYHRAALPEFFATGLLTCACVAWTRALGSTSRKDLAIWCNLCLLLVCATAGTHPITTLYGLPFFAAFAVISFFSTRPDISRFLRIFALCVLPLILLIACVAPWAMATRPYNRQFKITESFGGVAIFHKTIDNLFLRLTPVPVPYSLLEHDALIEHMECKNLDAQASISLMIAMVAMLCSLRRRTRLNACLVACLAVAIVSAAAFMFLSMSPMLNRLGHAARGIQFAYRLVTYINLSLLSAILISALHVHLRPKEEDAIVPEQPLLDKRISVAVIVLAASALVAKVYSTIDMPSILDPASNQRLLASSSSDQDVLHMPKSFFAYDYSMPSILKSFPENLASETGKLNFDLAQGEQFGEVQPAHADQPAPWLATNIQVFVWNTILCDGNPISQVDSLNKKCFTTVANHHCHQLQYRFSAPDIWQSWQRLTVAIFLTWCVATAALTLKYRERC
jgi:hypothetical protein